MRRLRAAGLGALGIAAIALVWGLYKALGPEDGVVVKGIVVLPRRCHATKAQSLSCKDGRPWPTHRACVHWRTAMAPR